MPKKPRYRIRTGARAASKVQEKDLIRKAKRVAKRPELILPTCENECGACPFDKISAKLKKVSEYSDDMNQLKKFSSWGDPLVRAYAATLTLAIEGKAPYLAVFRTPFGNATFAYRGKAKKEKLVGVQYFDDPKWRLLAVLDIVKKKKLYVYSTNEEMICTGREPDPPKKFVEETIASLKPNMVKKGTIYTCPHLNPAKVKRSKPDKHQYLSVHWISAGLMFGICRKCIKSSNDHTFGKLAQRIAAKDVKSDFEIDIIAEPLCKAKCKVCKVPELKGLPKDLYETYTSGEIGDTELMDQYLETVRDAFMESGKKIFILDNICYGPDMKSFIKALKPTTIEEKIGLNAVLKRLEEPAIFYKSSPGKVLTYYWKEYGKKAIFAVTKDAKLAKELYKKYDVTKTAPPQILKEANIKIKQRDIISALPKYENLPDIAEFADEITRIYKTKGVEDTARAIDKYRGGDTKVKSVAYAFLLALDRGSGKKWQYTKTEIDFAQYLKEPVRKLLDAEPDDYHDKLQNVLSATGSTEKIEK
jgi:hypothetical protein